jgi:predicted porin
MQANVRTENPVEGLDDRARLRAYGIAANFDLDDWFILTEFTQLTRNFDAGYKVTAPAYTVGAGYHWGPWTPFLNFANYKEKSSNLGMYEPQSYRRASLTLRYDLDIKSVAKAQVDRNRDVSNNFGGNVTVVRLAYERLF